METPKPLEASVYNCLQPEEILADIKKSYSGAAMRAIVIGDTHGPFNQ